MACNQPSPRLQLTCEAGDRSIAGLLLRKLAGLRAARGERVVLALVLALVPLLCTCRYGTRGRRQATGSEPEGRLVCRAACVPGVLTGAPETAGCQADHAADLGDRRPKSMAMHMHS